MNIVFLRIAAMSFFLALPAFSMNFFCIDVDGLSLLFSGCALKSRLMHKDHRHYLKTTSKNNAATFAKMNGIVKKVINAQGISFVKLHRNDQDKVWVALVDEAPTLGEKLFIDIQIEKSDFHSKVLNRRFKRIIFATKSIGLSRLRN